MSNVTKLIISGTKNIDIDEIITGLNGIIMSDRRMENGILEENLEYVKNSGIDIYEKLNMEEPLLSKDKSEYTGEDFTNAAIYLAENFCDERIEDVRTIGRAIYKKRVSETVSKPQVKGIKTEGVRNSNTGKKSEESKKNLVIAGIVVVAVVVVGILAITHN